MVAGDGIDRRGGKNTGLPRIIATNYEERKAQMRAYARAKYARNRAKGLTALGKQPKVRIRKYESVKMRESLQRKRIRGRNRGWVREEMFRRGKCAYHMEYWGHELPVKLEYIECFEWDHIDRSLKVGRLESKISWLQSRAALKKLQVEIARCALACSNCHRIKTARNCDWKPIAKVTEIEHLHLQMNLPI